MSKGGLRYSEIDLLGKMNIIYKLPTNIRRFGLIVIDSVFLLFAILISLKKNINLSLILYSQFWIATFLIYVLTGFYKSILRYYDHLFIYKNILRNFLIALSILVIGSTINGNLLKEINLFNFIFLNIIFTFFSRLFIRDFIRSVQSFGLKDKKNTIIYGAGGAGSLLASSIKYTSKYRIICFVDDDHNLIKRQINGISIYSPNNLPKLVKDLQIKTIILAIPSLSLNRRRDILITIQKLNIETLRVPEIEDISSDQSNISKLKSIKIEDLLCRDVVQADKKLMNKDIKNSVVCVNGGGGSIGSELCKQIISLKPKKLIVVDHSEYNLFQLEEQLNSMVNENSKFLNILGDIKDYNLMKNIFIKEKVDLVFHASAYKHVPLVELNPIQSILNNVRASEVICKLSLDCNIKKAILISSDKAVRPKSIMGATKRLSELIFQSSDQKAKDSNKKTIFAMVRFGNVLNSSGSVIPKFKKQISKGGPITITDKKMIRYFMTIKEAAELVIQSSSIAKGGEVFLLDMGKPVKIIDLAKQIIKLSGVSEKSESNISGDIEIIETGLRDGEKLYEELLIDAESKPTVHELIFCANEKMISSEKLDKELAKLNFYLKNYEIKKSFKLLKKIVPEWDPKKKYDDWFKE